MTLVGGDWIPDEKGFRGYAQAWICHGSTGRLDRIATGSKRAQKEVHVDLSQELISGSTYEKFQAIASWVWRNKTISAGSYRAR